MRYSGRAVTYIAIHFGLPPCLTRPASFPGRTAHPGESAGGGRHCMLKVNLFCARIALLETVQMH